MKNQLALYTSYKMNKAKKNYFLILVCILVFYSCNQKYENENTFNIDIRTTLKQKNHTIFLSELASKVKYIKLETNDSCLLSDISRLYLTEDYFFISDSRQLYQFDKNGGFIQQIGKIGNGPEEHSSRIKFSINQLFKEVYIYSYPGKMNIYDMKTGSFKRSFKVNFEVADFEIIAQDKIAFLTIDLNGFILKSSINEIYLSDKFGNIFDSVPDPNRKNNKNNVAGYVHSYSRDNKVYYMGTYKNILYSIDEQYNIKPYILFNLDNSIEWENLIVEPGSGDKLSNFVSIYRPLENQRYMFLSVQIGISSPSERVIKNILFNKLNEELNLTEGLINDIDGGMIFWPKFIFDNKLVSYYHPYELFDHLSSTQGSVNYTKVFLNLLNSLKEGDNPVLVIVD